MEKLHRISDMTKHLQLKKAFTLLTEECRILALKLESYSKILEAENKLAAVSSYDFVFAFRPVAKSISATLPVSNTETYLALVDQACKMLASGKEPAEVLWYFDLKQAEMW